MCRIQHQWKFNLSDFNQQNKCLAQDQSSFPAVIPLETKDAARRN
uniref:Uncharacterized protein n=1 Tax=Rhizophora mucronata TaxID=61149 RepID=A0A2P2QEF6_RHIMU